MKDPAIHQQGKIVIMNQAMEILNQKRMIRTKILRKNMAEAEPKAEAEAVEVAEAEAMSNAVAKALVKA